MDDTERSGRTAARDRAGLSGDEPPERERLAAVETLLLPDADAILERCAAYAAITDNGHMPFLSRLYRGHRRMFLHFLAAVRPVSTSQDRTLEQAIAFLLKHRAARSDPASA